jgi:hypothetical protein
MAGSHEKRAPDRSLLKSQPPAPMFDYQDISKLLLLLRSQARMLASPDGYEASHMEARLAAK